MRGKTRLAALSAAVVAVVVAGASVVVAPRLAHAAATHTVCPAGPPACDFATIGAAVAAASAGDTINVAAGTYVENLNITKSLTINGAFAGTDARSRSGSGETVLDASALASPNGYGIGINAANVTIDGLTITGAKDIGIYGYSASGAKIINNIVTANNSGVSELAGTNILIKHNVIKNSAGSAGIAGDGIYDDFGFQNLQIIENNILDNIQALTILPWPNTVPTGAITISGNTINTPSWLWNVTGSFDHNTVTGNAAITNPASLPTFGLKIGGQVSAFSVDHNTFTDLQAYGVKVKTDSPADAGTTWANNKNITIASNTFNQDVSVLNSDTYPDIMDLRSMDGTNTVTANTINLHGSFGGGATTAHGIKVMGTQTSLTISNNLLDAHGVGGLGSGSVAPTTGVVLCSAAVCPEALDAAASVSITGNRVYRFVYGLDSFAALNAGVAQAHTNCISGNTAYGAFSATGSALTATNNWWGAATGPLNATSNPGGEGNPVNNNVTFSPFTTSPATQCAGPVTTAVTATPNPVVSGNAVGLTATTSDSTTAGFAIASAQYTVDGGTWQTMAATDATFDQVTEALTAALGSGLSVGSHTLCVRGKDAVSNIGLAACSTLTVQTPPPDNGLSGQNVAPTPLPPGSIASSGAPSAPGTSSGPTSGRSVVSPATSSTNLLVVLIPALVILLAGLAAIGVAFLRRRTMGRQG